MTETPRLLPCGHCANRVLELAADVADHSPDADHLPEAADLANCPRCSAELAALRSRWAQVRLAAADPVRIPPGLVSRALSAVRTVRGRTDDQHIEIEVTQSGGVVHIPESTVLMLIRRLARDAAEALPGVRFRGLTGDINGLQVLLAVPYDVVLADVTSRVRRDLRSDLDFILGAAAPAVDVLVEDIVAP